MSSLELITLGDSLDLSILLERMSWEVETFRIM